MTATPHRRLPSGLLLLALLAARAAPGADEQGTMIRIVTDPAEAMISCDGIVKNAAPLTLTALEPGPHLLVAQKQGYREARRTVTLAAGQRMAVEMTLEPLMGLLLVHSEPSGADVQIDGADRGKTPLLITDLRAGTYRLRVASAGFLPKEVGLDIKDRVPQKIVVPLTSDSAALVLDSDPTGARVTVNGLDKGTTPCTLDRIPEGDMKLQLALDGYEPYEQTVKLVAGQNETLKAVLKPVPAKLQVVSLPTGARIYVNNQFRGEAPVTLDNVAPGVLRLRAELAGYETVARDVTLERAANITEEFRMEGNSGQIRISTEPAGISIFLDGKESGTTAAKAGEADTLSDVLTLDLLPAGQHEIEFSRKGYHSKKMSVAVEKGKAVTLHQALARRFVPDCEVRTSSETFKGVLLNVDPQGNVRIEIRPGIVKNIPAADVRFRGPLREEPAP